MEPLSTRVWQKADLIFVDVYWLLGVTDQTNDISSRFYCCCTFRLLDW